MFTRLRPDCQHPMTRVVIVLTHLGENQSRSLDFLSLLEMVETDSVIKAPSLITDTHAIQVTFLQLCYPAIIGFLVLIGP